MKAGIALDAWKVNIFKKYLYATGFEFELNKGLTENTRTLIIETDDMERLSKVIEEANKAARLSRKKKR